MCYHGWETIFHNTFCVIVNCVRRHSGVISDRQNVWEKMYVVVFRWSVLNIYIINRIAFRWFQPVKHWAFNTPKVRSNDCVDFLYYANRSRKQYAKQAKLRSKMVKKTSLSTKNKHKYAHDLQIVQVLSYEKESSIITKKDSKF